MAGQSIGKMSATLTADITQFQSQLNRASQDLRTFSEKAQMGVMGSARSLLSTFAPQLGSLFTGGGIIAAFRSFTNEAQEIVRSAKKMDVSVEFAQNLAASAKRAHTDLESLAGSMMRLEKAVVGAAGGSKEAKEALGQIGLKAADLIALTPEQMFVRVAQALETMHNPILRNAAAMQLLGKSYKDVAMVVKDAAKDFDQSKLPWYSRQPINTASGVEDAATLGKVIAAPFRFFWGGLKEMFGALASNVMAWGGDRTTPPETAAMWAGVAKERRLEEARIKERQAELDEQKIRDAKAALQVEEEMRNSLMEQLQIQEEIEQIVERQNQQHLDDMVQGNIRIADAIEQCKTAEEKYRDAIAEANEATARGFTPEQAASLRKRAQDQLLAHWKSEQQFGPAGLALRDSSAAYEAVARAQAEMASREAMLTRLEAIERNTQNTANALGRDEGKVVAGSIGP